MKAQPTTSSTARARINTVYPPNKRAVSYNQQQSRPCAVSPKSMAAASITKRKCSVASSQPQRTASYDPTATSARRTPPPQLPTQSRLSMHAHQRALIAQRNAALAQRAATRSSHLSSLDRGIRLLLEEEYREDVKAWMLEKEKNTLASASAMDQQPELQWHMRGHLLDFLLEIHLHFRLRPETLYLTLSILDRYVSRRIVYKKHYQLVGCVALWLAAKFEDAKERVPSVKDLKELCHNAYEEGAFVQMEGHVLGTVEWDLGHPTAESWLRVLCTETHITSVMTYGMFGGVGALNGVIDQTPFEETRTQHVARFLMELTLYSREYIQFVPSVLALGALNLARHVCGKTRRPADEAPLVLHMISLLDHTLSQNLDSVSQTLVKKYSYAYYSKASALVVSHYLRGGRFPLNTSPSVEQPESLITNVVSVSALRSAIRQAPVTPVRERRMQVRWGSGRTDVEETPGLVRSDSISSVVGMEVEEEMESESEREQSVFSQPREFEMDEEEDEVEDMEDSRRHVEDEDDDDADSEYEAPAYHHRHHHSSSSMSSASSGSMLTVPSSDDIYAAAAAGGESMPITPTTPMFQLDPFGSAQAHAQAVAHAHAQAQMQQVPTVAVVHCKDKENVVPNGGHPHHHAHHLHPHSAVVQQPCHPNVVGAGGVMVESGEDNMGGGLNAEYRQALLAIVP